MSTLITHDALPPMPADPTALVAAADALSPAGQAVGDGMRSAEVAWRSLPNVYDAPETSTAVAAIAPVIASAEDLEQAAVAAAAALRTLAEELHTLGWTHKRLEGDIEAHRSQVLAYRDQHGAGLEDSTDPLRGWGPYGLSRNLQLEQECAALQTQIEAAIDECVRSLARIAIPPGDIAFTSAVSPSSDTDWHASGEEFRTTLASAILSRLTAVDARGIEQLLREHPEWSILLRDTPPDPRVIAVWWAQLGPDSSAALMTAAPALVGALGGVPAAVRVVANRTVAEERREELGRLIDSRGYTLQPGTYERVRIQVPEAWQSEYDYLSRVISGDVQLYLYDRGRAQIIEMIGNPERADVIMTFMPGTNTTMESFYTSTPRQGITALTNWQVDNAQFGTDVAGFVVKQGDFPQLSADIFATGPQNNDMMEKLGRSYAQFSFELDALTPHTPIVSIEHSAGSDAGGAAEMAGAHFAARVALAGIGMTYDWRSQPGTEYYAMQAPNDINKNFDGIQAWNWGYAIKATEQNGFTELDSGIDGTSPAVWGVGAVSPPIALAMEASSQLDHHNRIISGDVTENGTVLYEIRRILESEAGTHG
ncbi:alpha/beta hydrolase [Microbacterium sp. SLBN-111]|uniref:alpha/beta hydrolase n=1 Tax=Microbacterium sp. SLBN-111 TaxID=3377733 RepID=UPI003C796155